MKVKLDLCPWCTKTLAECTCYGLDDVVVLP
jgi:hypothetical protein